MKPAIESHFIGKSLRWVVNTDIDEVDTELLYVNGNDGSWEPVTFGVYSLGMIIAKYMVRKYGFTIHRECSRAAIIHFDDDIYAGSYSHLVENNDEWKRDIANIPPEVISIGMQNSIEMLSVLDNLKKDLKILPSKLMTLDEFMDFYNDTPTDEYEFADVCMRYEVYKETYGNDQSIER